MDLKELTTKQQKVYNYCIEFLEDNDQLPTTGKIAKRFKFASPNAAYEHLRLIEKKGWFERNELNNRMITRVMIPTDEQE